MDGAEARADGGQWQNNGPTRKGQTGSSVHRENRRQGYRDSKLIAEGRLEGQWQCQRTTEGRRGQGHIHQELRSGGGGKGSHLTMQGREEGSGSTKDDVG